MIYSNIDARLPSKVVFPSERIRSLKRLSNQNTASGVKPPKRVAGDGVTKQDN